MNIINKRILIFLLILIIGSLASIIGYLDSRITTFEECENAGLLHRNDIYDKYDNDPMKAQVFTQAKCVLWTGKKFIKQNVSSVPFFPAQKEPAAAYMAALLSEEPEELELVDGCLRVDGYLIVWRYGFHLNIYEKEEIEIIDENYQPVARVGDKVKFGGGGISGTNIGEYSAQLPSTLCSGPYWILGEVVSDSGNEQFEKPITDYLLTQEHFSRKTAKGSGNFCAIQILNPEDKLFPLYVWVRCGEFVVQNGELRELSGMSEPAKIDYPNMLSYYDLSRFSYEAPRNGSFYSKDIETIFPLDVQKRIESFNATPLSKKLEKAALDNFIHMK